jgi:hypothetical protein
MQGEKSFGKIVCIGNLSSSVNDKPIIQRGESDEENNNRRHRNHPSPVCVGLFILGPGFTFNTLRIMEADR